MMIRGRQIGIVLNHFFCTGSIIITIIYEIAHVSCNILQGHQKSNSHETPIFPQTQT